MNFSRKSISRKIKAARFSGLFWGFLFGLTFGLMPWLSSMATAQRGYHAIGGEALILVFPLLVYWTWDSIKTFLKGMKFDEEMQRSYR